MNFVDKPLRSLDEAHREMALQKALHLQPMADHELRRLTDTELNEVVAKSRHNQELWESDGACYLKAGSRARVRQLMTLRLGANAELHRRADIGEACFAAAVQASKVTP